MKPASRPRNAHNIGMKRAKLNFSKLFQIGKKYVIKYFIENKDPKIGDVYHRKFYDF
jgi:hypothetical protein